MAKRKIKKDNVLAFFLGCLFMVVLFAIFYGGRRVINNYKDKKANEELTTNTANNTKRKDDKSTTVDGVIYTLNGDHVNERGNDCDQFNDILALIEGYENTSVFIKRDGSIYYLSTAKYSENNQKCILVDDHKADLLIDNYTIVDGKKAYEVRGNSSKMEWVERSYGDKDIALLLKKAGYVHAMNYKYDETNKHPYYYHYYIGYKEDESKLYVVTIEGYDNYETMRYKIKEEKEYVSFNGEKILYYYVPSSLKLSNNNEPHNLGVVLTDKSVYIQQVTNLECIEYNDVECQTEFVKYDYLKKYTDGAYILRAYPNIENNKYKNNREVSVSITTNKKIYDFIIKNES